MNELDILRSSDPGDFEKFVAERVLPILGLKVLSVTGSPNDAGCDIIALDEKFGNKWCVQVKRYSENKKVNPREVRDVALGMEHYGCKRGLIVTTSEVSGLALKEAEEKGIDYINGSRLLAMIRQYNIPISLTSKLVSDDERTDNSRRARKEETNGEEEKEPPSTKVKDDGVFLPISVSEAVNIAKEKLSHYKEVKLVSVKAHLKRLYIFRVKVSYKLTGRRSQSLILGTDGDEKVYEEVPTLVKSISCEVEYETDSEFYHNVRDKLTKEAEKQAPQGATDIEVKMESYKLAWVVSYYVLRFAVGLTKAEIIVDRQGKVKETIFDPLDERRVREFFGGKVVKQDGEIKVVREFDDKFLEELTINEVGETVKSTKRVKPEYAVSLVKTFYHVEGGVSRFKEVSGEVKVDILVNNSHYLAKVNNEGKIVDNVIVPDVSMYVGIEKGYNKKRRCLIVRDGDVIKVVDASGVVERKEIPKGIFSKLKFSVSNVITTDYSIDTNDPLELV
jgi:restriction system protein